MAVKIEEGKVRYRLHIPSLTKDGEPIQVEKRQAFYDFIQERLIRKNGGLNESDPVRGLYRSKTKTGKILAESVRAIESIGEFPFSDYEMSHWAKYLDQECILVEKTPNVTAYWYDGHIESIDNFQVESRDGFRIEYSLELNPEQFENEWDLIDDEWEIVDTKVQDIPDKYIVHFMMYDNDGQFVTGGPMADLEVAELMSECDIETNLLLQSLLTRLATLNSE